MSKLKATPKFKTEVEERAFWDKHDSSDYVGWKQVQLVLMPN
jgi:sucrose-6-phosphate hydrolase SacC (GH32 family)